MTEMPPMSPAIDVVRRALAQPFHPSDIQWKPVAFPRGRKDRALVVPFYDVRLVYDRLDEVVGPPNWQIRHAALAAGVYTEIGIRFPDGQWVWKGDIGMVERDRPSDSDDEEGEEGARAKKPAPKIENATKVKGDASDGAKRAAALWGIGRCYWMIAKSEDYWVAWNAAKKTPLEIPPLPDFALPYDMQKGTVSATASSKPAPESQPEDGPAIQVVRPYTPEQVRQRLDAHYARFKADPELKPATKQNRGLAVGLMEACFPKESAEAARKDIMLYFFAEDSVSALTNAHVATLLKYLDPKKGEKGWTVGPHVEVELRSILDFRKAQRSRNEPA